MSKVRRVLILSVKAGAGHLRAAEAVERGFKERYPDVQVVNCDALEFTNAAFRKSFSRTYERLAKDMPSIWGMIYDRFERESTTGTMKRLSELTNRLNTSGLKGFVKEYDPDAVVVTHYLASDVLAPRRLKGKLRGRLYTVLTDYDIHTMWLNSGTDAYFVATDEMAHALRMKGIGDADVCVTGIPVLPEFAQTYPSKSVMRRRLGLSPEGPMVLMAAGGFGMVPVDEAVEVLAGDVPDARFIALAGRNAKLKASLDKVAEKLGDRVASFGFVDNMHELMAASDLIVTKCGGLTSSECLAMGLPMVVIRPIPGQEERNADFLLESGAAVRANSFAHLVYKVRHLLDDRPRLRRMARASRKAGKPLAAEAIAEYVVNDRGSTAILQ